MFRDEVGNTLLGNLPWISINFGITFDNVFPNYSNNDKIQKCILKRGKSRGPPIVLNGN